MSTNNIIIVVIYGGIYTKLTDHIGHMRSVSALLHPEKLE